jgi:hypothetical protein
MRAEAPIQRALPGSSEGCRAAAVVHRHDQPAAAAEQDALFFACGQQRRRVQIADVPGAPLTEQQLAARESRQQLAIVRATVFLLGARPDLDDVVDLHEPARVDQLAQCPANPVRGQLGEALLEGGAEFTQGDPAMFECDQQGLLDQHVPG